VPEDERPRLGDLLRHYEMKAAGGLDTEPVPPSVRAVAEDLHHHSITDLAAMLGCCKPGRFDRHIARGLKARYIRLQRVDGVTADRTPLADIEQFMQKLVDSGRRCGKDGSLSGESGQQEEGGPSAHLAGLDGATGLTLAEGPTFQGMLTLVPIGGGGAWARPPAAGGGAAGREGDRSEQQERPARRARGGRPPDADPRADQRVSDAWRTGQYETHEQLGRELGLSGREVKLALDRHRKRAQAG
jgi:hypothetical protein